MYFLTAILQPSFFLFFFLIRIPIGSLLFISDQLEAVRYLFPYCSLPTELICLLLSYRCTPIGSLLFISDQLAAVLHFFLAAVLQLSLLSFSFLFLYSYWLPPFYFWPISSHSPFLPCSSPPTKLFSLFLSFRCIPIGSLLFISDQLAAVLHFFLAAVLQPSFFPLLLLIAVFLLAPSSPFLTN